MGLPVGSTSAFMAVIAAAFDRARGPRPAGRAAAALGVYTDTSALLHGATPLDFKMFELLTRDEETQDILDDLRDYRVPPEWYVYRAAAFRNQEVTGAVRIAPIGFVREEHRDVIAEIANELLRVEGTSIAIAIAVTERGAEVSVRADTGLLGHDQPRIVRVIDYLLEVAFPGVSGFKYDRRPPHRVEGGACVPLTAEERAESARQRRGPVGRERADPRATAGAGPRPRGRAPRPGGAAAGGDAGAALHGGRGPGRSARQRERQAPRQRAERREEAERVGPGPAFLGAFLERGRNGSERGEGGAAGRGTGYGLDPSRRTPGTGATLGSRRRSGANARTTPRSRPRRASPSWG